MIEVRELTKRYGDLVAVDRVSFTARKGEVVGFLGPNGAGKTTTMRIITGFLPATYGTVKVEDFDIFDDSYEVRKRIGYLPENPPIYADMTVTSYLQFVGRIKGIPRAALNDAVDRALTRCGLTDVTRRVLGHLSKGYRQRVGLAQAHHPRAQRAGPRRTHHRSRSAPDRRHPLPGARARRPSAPSSSRPTSCRKSCRSVRRW